MNSWKKLNECAYEFRGKILKINVERVSNREGWFVTCRDARLEQVALMDPEVEQACNEAIGLVADRIGWLARGWIKDLKGVRSLILDDLDPERRG